MCVKGGISNWNPQRAENWCSYTNSVTRKLQVSCWGEFMICFAMATNFPTLLLTGLMNLTHFVMYSIITRNMTVGSYA